MESLWYTEAPCGLSLLWYLTTQHNRKQLKKKIKTALAWPCATLPLSLPHTPLTDVTFWRRKTKRAVRRPQQHGHGIYHGSKCEEGDQPWLGYETELGLRLGTLKMKGHVFPFPRRFKSHDIVLLKMTWKPWEASHKNKVIISPLWPVTIMKRMTVHSTGFTTPAASSHFIGANLFNREDISYWSVFEYEMSP